ncbi:hypothetical protein BHM03_00028209 [Ensete ventricosum]|nr:hypothetical protein BHM03_00028209 [Ensete ventricosum]
MENVRKTVTEADGYQPHLIAPEQGYRRLIESSVVSIRGPAESAGKQLGKLLDEDPAIMERRTALAKRLELYRSAQAEIDAVAWTNK